VDWPDDLRAAVGGYGSIVPGGIEFDGRDVSAVEPQVIRAAARAFKRDLVEAIVVSAVFSPVSDVQERAAAAIVAEELPGVPVVCSAAIRLRDRLDGPAHGRHRVVAARR